MSNKTTKPVQVPVNLLFLIDPAIEALNHSSDQLHDMRYKVAFIQEAFAVERGEMYLDNDTITGLHIILTQVVGDLSAIGNELTTASNELQAIK